MENTTSEKPTVMAVGIKYGIFSGLAAIVMFLVGVMFTENAMQGATSWISTGLSIVLLVLAHKNFKDSGDGFMSYGQGVGIGFWFTLIGSVIAVLVMYVYLTIIDTTAMENIFEQQALKMEESGQPEEAIEVGMEWTRKLFWPFAIIGSIFFGMIIALVVSIFTQKKNPEPGF